MGGGSGAGGAQARRVRLGSTVARGVEGCSARVSFDVQGVACEGEVMGERACERRGAFVAAGSGLGAPTTRWSGPGWRAESWSETCPPDCGRMSGAMPERPGSSPYRSWDRCPKGCYAKLEAVRRQRRL